MRVDYQLAVPVAVLCVALVRSLFGAIGMVLLASVTSGPAAAGECCRGATISRRSAVEETQCRSGTADTNAI